MLEIVDPQPRSVKDLGFEQGAFNSFCSLYAVLLREVLVQHTYFDTPTNAKMTAPRSPSTNLNIV